MAKNSTDRFTEDEKRCPACHDTGIQGGPPDNYFDCPACCEYSHPDDRVDDRIDLF